MSAPLAACARAISWKLRYFPVPTMRRDAKARPAMTRLSGMGNLYRIFDLQRLTDKSKKAAAAKRGRRSADSRPFHRMLRPKTRALGLVDARGHKPAQIHPNAKRVAVELQWHAAAIVELEIQITNWLAIDTGVEAVVAN